MAEASVNIAFETVEKRYSPTIKAGKFRCELLDSNGAVFASSETMELIVRVDSAPPTSQARARIVRLEDNGNTLPGSEYLTDPFDIDQMIAVASTATVTVSFV